MAVLFGDRVKETSSTTGTGTLTLAGVPNASFQTFSAGIGGNNEVFYSISSEDNGEYETGIGTVLTGPDRLQRDTVIKSSNGDALVSFTAGGVEVICAILERHLNRVGALLMLAGDQTGIVTATNTSVLYEAADLEVFDDHGFHDPVTNPDRLTVPAGFGGIYMVTAHTVWGGDNATGIRQTYLRHFNSGDASVTLLQTTDFPGSASESLIHGLTNTFDCADGDYIRHTVVQQSGSNRSIRGGAQASAVATAFSMWRVGDN